MKRELYLLRHGKTEANEKGVYCGKTDLSLSETGVKELLALQKGAAYDAAELFFHTGLQRTVETLALLYPGQTGEEVKELREYDFGIYEMQRYEKLKKDKQYIEWITDETDRVYCPAGENRALFKERIEKGLEKVIKRLEQEQRTRGVVVCHGGTIAYLMEKLFPAQKNYYEWQPAPGTGYVLVIENGQVLCYQGIGEIVV